MARHVGTGLMGEVQGQRGGRQFLEPGLQTFLLAGCCLYAEPGVSCQGGVPKLHTKCLFQSLLAEWGKLGSLGSYGRR